MKTQSTNRVLMIEPAEFYANPQTAETNAYQAPGGVSDDELLSSAMKEFQAFRTILEDADVEVCGAKGVEGSPDMIFPNWFFTHESGELILCPMLNENRQAERTPSVISLLQGIYPQTLDWTSFEDEGRALESTASIVSDHINKRCYIALSARTDRDLAQKWADHRGYEALFFETRAHTGIPVYHTDCVMWIGTSLAGVCDGVIIDGQGDVVVNRLSETHEVIRFSNEQLRTFCGNALEVQDQNGRKMLAISQGAVDSLSVEQLDVIERHFYKILSVPLDTIECYGGGSARCMLAELF